MRGQLAGNFAGNCEAQEIKAADIRVAINADPVLQSLFLPLQTKPAVLVRAVGASGRGKRLATDVPQQTQVSNLFDMKLDDILKEMMTTESAYFDTLQKIVSVCDVAVFTTSSLTFALQVFYEPFDSNPTFVSEEVCPWNGLLLEASSTDCAAQQTMNIFGNLKDIFVFTEEFRSALV